MEVNSESFLQPSSGYKNHEIKKMITTGMLKRQVWMADDDEFDHIVKNSQRVLRLNDQYKRRHYIRAIKMFDRKPSMLHTMIVKSLVHCWDNFEQNARMLARC